MLYTHPFRGCFTTASAQFLCNIFATKADDVQALWEASGETQRLLQPSIKPEDEASLTAILNGWEKMALAILKRVFITGGNVQEDAVQHVKEKYASDFNVCPSKFVETQTVHTHILIYCQNHNLNEGQQREIVIHFKNVFFKYITDDPLRAEQLKARIFNDNGDTSAPHDIPAYVQRAIDVLYDDHEFFREAQRRGFNL